MTLARCISSRRIAVIGCGHVGLATAAFLAERGHHVAAIDVDAARLRAIACGEFPFVEPGLADLTAKNIVEGRLHLTPSFEAGLFRAWAVFLCVDTPASVSGAADLSNLRSAVIRSARVLAAAGNAPFIVNKSTSPIGTAETIEAIVGSAFAASGLAKPPVVANPEFLREGSALADMAAPARIVLGANRREDAEVIATLYAGIEAPIVIVGLRAAEMIKYVSNAYLATRVSFANEVARLCESLEVDADDVLAGASLDPRIGSAFFRPGIGYGGSCLPKDVAALAHAGESAGVVMRVISAADQANRMQRKHAVNCIRRLLGGLEGKEIAAWGLSFKAGTEDLRESPALEVIALLQNEGAHVRVFDPSLTGHERSLPVCHQDVVQDPLLATADADALAILTDWELFRTVPMQKVAAVMRGDLIYDGRNMRERVDVESAGLRYQGIGRPIASRQLARLSEVPA